MTHALDRGARHRGVGGDHAVDLVRDQQSRDLLHRRGFQIRRDLDGDRRVLAVLLRELSLLGFERRQQRAERLRVLKIAQALGIR
jgi:hypothetical protein